MQISDGQTDEAALPKMGYEAVRLLCSGEIRVLAARFGYALAFGREPEIAIREDLAECLRQFESQRPTLDVNFSREVTFFQPNDTGLFALVSCVVPTSNGRDVLVELVVTSNGANKYVTLEDISAIESC